jgi:diguanylate cyclase (GGDEF)-like protein
VQVDLHAVPVVDKDGVTHGATVVLHDASPEASLEKRCQSLHERATKDPLTQVANRAEFDRALEMFVAAHLERGLPCSLVICDIDHFKRINDTYGHPAGDEALKSFASLLKAFCRQGDLVARYGGEEFVLLSADCNNATASNRAEEIRRTISEHSQQVLNGQCITASFGVTEIQYGDTAATMLRRADRALLEAKQRGRNMVVQLGGGMVGGGTETEEPKPRRRWFQRRGTNTSVLLEKWLATPVPMQVAIEKLRGFVEDHFAEITSVDGHDIKLTIEGQRTNPLRRTADRSVPFLVELKFSELQEDGATPGATGGRVIRTSVFVAIRPKRDRDRRRADAQERARMLMSSIKAYLMATEEVRPAPVVADAETNVLPNFLRKRS